MANLFDDAQGIIQVMELCSEKLPIQWEDDFWLGSIQNLAELISETRFTLSQEQQGVLVAIGAMMCRQVAKEAEALSLTEQVLDRARDGGGRG